MAKVRTVVNQRQIRRMERAHEQGMADIGRAVLDAAVVPDAPPYGKGLVETGAFIVVRGGDEVAGTAELPRSVDPGRGVTLAVGYDFPGRFLEGGTIKMAAQPFVTPAVLSVLPRKAAIMRAANRRARV